MEYMKELPNEAQYYKDIIYNYNGSIIVIDKTGTLVFCNNGTCALTRMTRDQLIGRTAYELKESKVFSESSLIITLETKKPSICYLVINGNKDQGIYAYSVPIFDETGNIKYVIAFSQGEAFSEEYYSRIEAEKKNITNMFKNIINKSEESQIIAVNPQMRALFDFAEHISKIDSNVLIYGESGTGKEVLAKHIHNCSSRKNEIFIPINCSAIPDELIESELFGYEKGSFTGANREGKPGMFELANNGTLFLDEIGDLPIHMQPKLLRVLETGEVRRIGGTRSRKLNVRIISATNKNLTEMIKNQTFREDLYYRLSTLPLNLPPLRQRPEDIEPLIEFFFKIYNKKFNTDIKMPRSGIESLKKYSWPGNVRELKNLVERYVVTDGKIGTSIYKSLIEFPKIDNDPEAITAPIDLNNMPDYSTYIEDCEKRYFKKLLEKTKGNVLQISNITGLHISGIYRKLNKYGLVPKDYSAK